MIFEEALASPQSFIIKQALLSLLDELTPSSVLAIHQAFKNAADKQSFFEQFESKGSNDGTSPVWLEQWMHYCWIRLELLYLASQKAALNHITYRKAQQQVFLQMDMEPAGPAILTASEVQAAFKADAPNNPNRGMPFQVFKTRLQTASVPLDRDLIYMTCQLESIDAAIGEDAARGVSIEQSIQILSQLTLQIVGTEHPTDPLSQEARDVLTRLAHVMDEESPDEDAFKHLLAHLMTLDAIPPVRHTVVEEVNRNIHITLDKLYDNLPHFVEAILTAYQVHYGEELYALHESAILEAIKGGYGVHGVTTQPLVRDASWPGFDADGNENVTASDMRNSIRLYRIRVAEKHSETLKRGIADRTKAVERTLREMLFNLADQLFPQLELLPLSHRQRLLIIQNNAGRLLTDRKFDELYAQHKKLVRDIDGLEIDLKIKTVVNRILHAQKTITKTLIHLTRFSGMYVSADGKRHHGAIQQFDGLFAEYKRAILDNTDAIFTTDTRHEKRLMSSYIVDQFQELTQAHALFLTEYPELNQTVRYFGIQLRCFGMTYGLGHVRQDSTIFLRVWDALLGDLKSMPIFSHYALFKELQGRCYRELTPAERMMLHKQLQNGSVESRHVLETIYQIYHNTRYLSDEYKSNPDFFWVNTELDRLSLALFHEDMFENIIISNAECAANILEVESLLALLPQRPNQSIPTIVPLLEKYEDLKNYESILFDYIKTKVQQRLAAIPDITGDISAFMACNTRDAFRVLLDKHRDVIGPHLKSITIEVMVGFSDTERVSGVSALIAVQQVQENAQLLCDDFGVTLKLYHGPGGDPNRGGLKRRDKKATLQGNARSNLLNTPTSTQWYRENQFYRAYQMLSNPKKRMEITCIPESMQGWLAVCMAEGTAFYEHLHDTKQGLGQLTGFMLGQGAHWLITMLNSSSRATQRGVSENLGDRTAAVQRHGKWPNGYIHPDKPRAITAAQMKEALRDYVDFIGPGAGLRAIGQEKAAWLYDYSETFRDMVEKVSFGIVMRDASFSAYALFGNDRAFIPMDKDVRNQWADECQRDFPSMLQGLCIETMSHDPACRMELLTLLSKLVAYIDREFELTRDFLVRMNQSMHRTTNVLSQDEKSNLSLLSRYPEWQAQARDIIESVEPLSHALARFSQWVALKTPLDEVYLGLNEAPVRSSSLTGVGRLLGNVAAGITAARIMPPGFYEKIHVDYSENNPRHGFIRAQKEALSLGVPLTEERQKGRPVFRFFDDRGDTKRMLEAHLEHSMLDKTT